MSGEKVIVFTIKSIALKMKGLVEELRDAENKLSEEINAATEKLAELTSRHFPPALTEALNKKYDSYSSGLAEYMGKVAAQIGDIGISIDEIEEMLEKMEKVPSSRDSSRDRGTDKRGPLQFLNKEHLLPPLLKYEECRAVQFQMWKKSFQRYLSGSHPNGVEVNSLRADLMARLDLD